jgi:general stress protein 26
MDRNEALKRSLALLQRSPIALVGSCDDAGFPNIKAMFNLEPEGLPRVWFGTNTSSNRVKQFKKYPKACVYYVDEKTFEGLLLVGEMEILQDPESCKKLWRPGFEKYYPLGETDPDYSVLRFKTRRGDFYHGLQNIDFEP